MKTNELSHLLNYSETHEKVITFYYNKLVSSITFFFMLFIIIMLVMLSIEYVYIKNFIKKRKFI